MASTGYGPYITGAGFGLEAFAELAQGINAAKRSKRTAEYNAQVTEANAQAQAQAAQIEALQLERQAAFAREEALVLGQSQVYQEERQRERNERIIGQTRAIIGASGLMMSGSPLAVLEDTVRQQEMDVLAGQYQAKLAQRAAGERATQLEYGAELARYGAGERLRVGGAQAGLLRSQADGSGVGAGLLKATGSLARGAATTAYLLERQDEALLPTKRRRKTEPSLVTPYDDLGFH